MAFRGHYAVYPDARGVIRTAEVEECGKRSRRPISYLVPLELDCRHDDDEIRLRPRERQRDAEEEDADDNEEDDASITRDLSELNNSSLVSEGMEGQCFLPDVSIDKSISPSTSQYDSTRTADADGQRFLPDASAHRTSGSSRESGLAIGTNDRCIVSASPSVVPESHTPSPVATQTREGVERDEEDAPTNARPQRRVARQQRALLSRLIEDGLL